jgi:hypothetical protein
MVHGSWLIAMKNQQAISFIHKKKGTGNGERGMRNKKVGSDAHPFKGM